MKSREFSATRRPKTGLPKGVWFQKRILADGRLVRYGYLGRGKGSVGLGREGTAEFVINLAAALKREPASGTVEYLIFQYKCSPEFARLADRTKADYRKLLDKIQAKFGPLSLRAMADREIARHLFAWRDSMAATPRRADYAVQVLKVVLGWGQKRGYLEVNRAEGIGRLHRGDRRESIWSPAQIEAFRSSASEPLVRVLTLALETGQRQADLLALTWDNIEGNVIKLQQAKTKVRVAVPVSPTLKACLDRLPKAPGQHVLTRKDGAPWGDTGNTLRAAWRDACRKAGVVGVTFHDLRGTFVTMRLAEGWTTQEVAMCTGHSLRDLAMLDTYADRGTVAMATANRLAQGAK